MKVQITENQLKKMIKSLEVENTDEVTEQEVSSEPTAGTSTTQSGGPGYPQVGTYRDWETFK